MATVMDQTFTFTQAQLHSLMEEASQRGARQALAAIGLGDEHALRDLTELRSLIDAYRAIKRSMLVTFGKAIALAVVSALVAYFWFRH